MPGGSGICARTSSALSCQLLNTLKGRLCLPRCCSLQSARQACLQRQTWGGADDQRRARLAACNRVSCWAQALPAGQVHQGRALMRRMRSVKLWFMVNTSALLIVLVAGCFASTCRAASFVQSTTTTTMTFAGTQTAKDLWKHVRCFSPAVHTQTACLRWNNEPPAICMDTRCMDNTETRREVSLTVAGKLPL